MRYIAGAAASPKAMRGFEKAYQSALQPVIEAMQRTVLGSAIQRTQADGTTTAIIPPSSESTVLQSCGDLIQRFFVGPDFRSPFTADGVTPLATYPRILNYWLAWVTVQVVSKHATFMQANLRTDVQRWLVNRLSQELITQTPQAFYDAAHTWIDPRGYRLSDRIWQVSIETRRKIDALLAEGIRTGRSAFDIARDLERFLQPGAGLRTSRPYGRNASYHALRLSRTEIAYAHSNATHAAAMANPFVDGWDWALSAQHPKFDICDKLATIGMRGERLRDPYPLDGREPIVVRSSHPQCICTNRTVVGRGNRDVDADLRERMQRGEQAPVTPINVFGFVKRLLGSVFTSLIWREVSEG